MKTEPVVTPQMSGQASGGLTRMDRAVMRAAARESAADRRAQEEKDAGAWWTVEAEARALRRVVLRRMRVRPEVWGLADDTVHVQLRGHWLSRSGQNLSVQTDADSRGLKSVSELLQQPGEAPAGMGVLPAGLLGRASAPPLRWAVNLAGVLALVMAVLAVRTLGADPMALLLTTVTGGAGLCSLVFVAWRLSQGRHIYTHMISSPDNYEDSIPGVTVALTVWVIVTFVAYRCEMPLLPLVASQLIGAALIGSWLGLSALSDMLFRRIGAAAWRQLP